MFARFPITFFFNRYFHLSKVHVVVYITYTAVCRPRVLRSLCVTSYDSVFRLRGFHAVIIVCWRNTLSTASSKKVLRRVCDVSGLLYLLRAGVRPGSMYSVVRSVPVAGRWLERLYDSDSDWQRALWSRTSVALREVSQVLAACSVISTLCHIASQSVPAQAWVSPPPSPKGTAKLELKL